MSSRVWKISVLVRFVEWYWNMLKKPEYIGLSD